MGTRTRYTFSIVFRRTEEDCPDQNDEAVEGLRISKKERTSFQILDVYRAGLSISLKIENKNEVINNYYLK